jgi:glycyl-tRNA synthetase beta chain
MPEPMAEKRATLLVEVLTEELPPKSLRALSEAFLDLLFNELAKSQLVFRDPRDRHIYATPRRLAVLVPNVAGAGQDRENEVTGPSAKAPQEAIAGFARKQGVSVESLGRQSTPKGEVVVARVKIKGLVLEQVLPGFVEQSLKSLPIPKLMRWGTGDAQFVRPVHGLVMMHGAHVVPGSVFGVRSGNATRGHRFMGQRILELARADEYAERLEREGRVIAEFALRRAEIDRQLKAAAREEHASLGGYADLLDEVTALVEYPQVYAGGFDPAFLEVPQECLILTMRQNQKYFPLFDEAGKLRPRFLIVANMKVDDPRHIVGGNERVVRPRLEDARFFYEQDRRQRLEVRVPRLGAVVYHRGLGTQLERVERLQLLSGALARELGVDVPLTERAAWLAKADLLTGMVGEFPELQGVMGRYYALHDGEPGEVADAIEAHYRPRFAGDALPEAPIACAVALADKLDALAGLFSIGEAPTGERDPFGLRRAALGVVRILVERRLPLALPRLLEAACAPFQGRARGEVQSFIYERARGHFREAGYSANEVEAVLSLAPARLDRLSAQLEAVRAFASLPEAESLAAANKRIGNILKQAGERPDGYSADVMTQPEEKTLARAYALMQGDVEGAFNRGDYTGALKALASLKAPVDAFFDKVMVMDKDPRVRANRIGFLGTLHSTMNRVADLSKLAK